MEIKRIWAAKDDPRALEYLKSGRDALANLNFQHATRYFKKARKLPITKALEELLLWQLANTMDQLEFYDQQQTFLEELVELNLTFKYVRKLMDIYLATNNEKKKTAFAEKIKQLAVENDEDEKNLIILLAQAKDHSEVLARSLEWLDTHPDDADMARNVINTYVEQQRIEEAVNFTNGIVEIGLEDKLLMEISNLKKEIFDFEAARDYLLKHLEIHKENVYGVNKVAHTLMTNACYNGTLENEDYIDWEWRAHEGTRPPKENGVPEINTDFFRKIRVGFVSYDFRAHSVGKFIMSLFDKIGGNTGIETYCYYTYPDHKDDYTAMIQENSDVFKFVGRYSDKQLRKELLEDKLDILVDLNGQTAGTKLALLAERFAPIQVTWMGFPFSSFYYNIDYIIGDHYFDDDNGETQKYCTEKILKMDNCYMCFALMADLYVNIEPPQEYKGYITLGMMNNPNKYSEESIKTWQKCLEAIPNARLLIQLSKFGVGYLQDKLKERFARFGLDMSRVDFGTDYGQQGYYRTYNECDVMLDSFPFGGGTTTPEAIWMGVPVIGCKYHMRHGRMAYCFMSNVGLGDLCADSIETYPQKVKEVAENLELLRDLRENLRGRLRQTPLFDTKLFREGFENAMRDAFVRHCLDNKKPFEPDNYEDIGVLLRDCVRSAEILARYAEKGENLGFDNANETTLIDEYRQLNGLLLEELAVMYEEERGALVLLEKAAQMLELLPDDINGAANAAKIISGILVKFA